MGIILVIRPINLMFPHQVCEDVACRWPWVICQVADGVIKALLQAFRLYYSHLADNLAGELLKVLACLC